MDILGIGYRTWNSLHTWSSLAMIAGVGAHLALHWQWMVVMTKWMLSGNRQGAKKHSLQPVYGRTAGAAISRRAFLVLGGVATASITLAIAGYKAIFDAITVEAGQDGTSSAGTGQGNGVACPFGLVNDPYPGRCRHYVDTNGDGMCDYSVAGSGGDLSTGNGKGVGGEGFRSRPRWAQPQSGGGK